VIDVLQGISTNPIVCCLDHKRSSG
jgi:hypothetical protein